MSSGTTQMTRPAQAVTQATSTWSTIFPAEQGTVQKSAVFVKKLLAVGISSVTYLRTLFPERAYGDHNLDGLKLKVLLEDSSCPPARALVHWIQACCEAIDKRYLRQLTLAIYEDPAQPDVVLETYTYKFKYTKGREPEMELTTSSSLTKQDQKFDVRKPTQKLLRTVLLLTQSLQPLPKKVYLGMKLNYYDEVTPADYEPNGFLTSSCNDYQYEHDYVNVSVGEVSTRYHNVKVRVCVDKNRFFEDEKSGGENNVQEIEESDRVWSPDAEGLVRRYASNQVNRTPSSSGTNSLLMKHPSGETKAEYTQKASERHANKARSSIVSSDFPLNRSQETVAEKAVGDAVPSVTPPRETHLAATNGTTPPGTSRTVPEMSTQKTMDVEPSLASTTYSNVRTPTMGNACVTPGSIASVRSILVTSPSVPDPEYPVRCPCGVNLDDGLMILCDRCSKWQHAVCFNVLDEREAPSQHICELCCDPAFPCTDQTLREQEDVANTCLYRRTLVFLRDYDGSVTYSVVSQRLGVNITMGRKIVTRLNSEKILKKRGAKGGRKVNKECLAAYAFPAYLKRMMRTEIFPSGPSSKAASPNKETTPTRNGYQSLNGDTTPDLPIASMQPSLIVHRITTANEMYESQDVDVGTQQVGGLFTRDYNGSETMATAGSERGDKSLTEDLLQESLGNKDDGKEESGKQNHNTQTEPDEGKPKRRKLLSRHAKLCHKVVSPAYLGPFEINNSQESDCAYQKKRTSSVSQPM